MLCCKANINSHNFSYFRYLFMVEGYLADMSYTQLFFFHVNALTLTLTQTQTLTLTQTLHRITYNFDFNFGEPFTCGIYAFMQFMSIYTIYN